jgi:hypothetical protein
MIKRISSSFFLAVLLYQSSIASHTVYLLHGFGSAPIFMSTIDRYLKKKDFTTVNYGYPSLTQDLTICADSLRLDIERRDIDTVSFVTHSMGALVLRSMLGRVQDDSLFPKAYRIVMIAPPNHGAELADFFAPFKALCYLLGPNIQHMKTDTGSLANHLPVPRNMEIGIIIGVKNAKQGFNPFIEGDNDGYITPHSAKLGTEKESVFVPAEHSMIIHNRKVLELINAFLTKGSFKEK